MAAKLPKGITRIKRRNALGKVVLGGWRVLIRVDGVRQGGVYDTLDEAIAAASEIRSRTAPGQASAQHTPAVKEARSMTVGDLMEWYLDKLIIVDGDERSLPNLEYDSDAKNLRSKARYWLNDETAFFLGSKAKTKTFVRDVLVDNLLPSNLESWWKGYKARPSASTIAKRLDVISKAIKAWNKLNHGPARFSNPVEGHEIKPPSDPSRERRFEPGEEANLIQACESTRSKWLRACVVLAVETTLREQELVNLLWQDIDFEKKSLRATNLKHEKVTHKFIPLNDGAICALNELQELAQTYPEEFKSKVFPIKTTRGVIHAFEAALKKTDPEIKNFHFHDLRHEGISRIVDNNPNINPLQLAAMTGHTDIRTLQKYFKAEQEALQIHVDAAYQTRLAKEQAKKDEAKGTQ